MNHPDDQAILVRPGPGSFLRLRRPIVEWVIWVLFGAVIYVLTGEFDQELPEYAFGTAGWPRALCIAVFIGATGQLGYQILMISRSREQVVHDNRDMEKPAPRLRDRLTLLTAQRLGIFSLPLVYLYVMPSLGFFFVTPFFVLGLLLLLDVKSPVALLGVTGIVYLTLLLIFTRLFYVALPVGRVPFFYDLNNAIIVLARTGL